MSHLRLVPDAKPPITNPELDHAIFNRETFMGVVTTIGALIKQPKLQILPTLRIIHPVREPEFGTVGHPQRDIAELAVSSGFPNALWDHGDMSKEEAIQFTADYIHAYQIVTCGVRKAQKMAFSSQIHKFSTTLNTELWSPEFALEGGAVLAMPYRAAATVALTAHGIDGVYMNDVEPPYPPHLASLQNPLDVVQFRSLSGVFK